MEDHSNILKSNGSEEYGSNYKDQKLESAKGEIGESKEENETLKLSLAQVVKGNFFNISQQDKQVVTKIVDNQEESELVSLSLGISSKGQTIMDYKRNSNGTKNIKDENLDEGLALGLNVTFDPSSRTEEGKEEENWPPSKVLKTTRTCDITTKASQHTIQLKKARVCIRARCDNQTMNDGGHWRKYGQKMAKGNPCPRAYYRCTVSSSCPVRKRVQRCAEDMSILITTYEGTHDHPLPTSATAMAYTTSAAASMLQCPSLNSQQGLTNSHTLPNLNSNFSYNHNALNYKATSKQFSRPQQLYFQNASTLSPNSHPTITLDLTTPQTPFPTRKFNSSFSSTSKISSTNLNISSTYTPLQSNMPQSTWSPYSGNFNYGGLITQNRNQYVSLMNNGKHPFQGHIDRPTYMMSNHVISQQPLRDSFVATTKAITTNNPKVQSALTAALTTYVGRNGVACDGVKENHVVADNATLKLSRDSPYTIYNTEQVKSINLTRTHK